MHITFSFTSPEISSLRLPSANLHLFQSMLYSFLPFNIAAKIHDEGFDSDGRKMKLFAMGWPVASARPQFGENTIIFPLPLKLTVSTPIHELITGFTAGAMSWDDIRIGNNHVVCSGIEKHEFKADANTLTIRTLSPITCYASVERNGKQYTKYFRPESFYDNEFQESIRANLLRKFRLLNPDKDIPSGNFTITPIGQMQERVSMFEKGGLFPVKGWWGKFKLKGDKELLQIALDCGLGAKNSSGWGCITLERR